MAAAADAKRAEAAAARRLHLALMEGNGNSRGQGSLGAAGEGVEDGLAMAVADGYKPSPYLQEVVRVLEDTKVGRGRFLSYHPLDALLWFLFLSFFFLVSSFSIFFRFFFRSLFRCFFHIPSGIVAPRTRSPEEKKVVVPLLDRSPPLHTNILSLSTCYRSLF